MKRLRTIRFMERSALPVSAACVVASGVREALASAIGAEVAVRLFEPALPSHKAWSAILQGARIYRLRGSSAEEVLIVRPADAAALAGAAFGETEVSSPMLSPMETAALDRLVMLLAGQCGAVCGGISAVEPVPDAGALVTYFEVQIEQPVRARIGIGLRRDPVTAPVASLNLDDLADISINVGVRVDLGRVPAAQLAALEPGDVLPLGDALSRAMLLTAGRPLALGECGVSANRYAFAVHRLP